MLELLDAAGAGELIDIGGDPQQHSRDAADVDDDVAAPGIAPCADGMFAKLNAIALFSAPFLPEPLTSPTPIPHLHLAGGYWFRRAASPNAVPWIGQERR